MGCRHSIGRAQLGEVGQNHVSKFSDPLLGRGAELDGVGRRREGIRGGGRRRLGGGGAHGFGGVISRAAGREAGRKSILYRWAVQIGRAHV